MNNEIIHSYTRAEAIEDGVLIDLTGLAAQFDPPLGVPFKFPVACTSATFEKVIEWGESDRKGMGQSAAGRLHDLFSVMRHAAGTVKKPTDRMTFLLKVIDRDSGRSELVQLWMHCGPGDRGEPVITVMLEGED